MGRADVPLPITGNQAWQWELKIMSHYEPGLFDGQQQPPVLELLRAVQHALNAIPNTRLRGNPLVLRDSYQLAALVAAAVERIEGQAGG